MLGVSACPVFLLGEGGREVPRVSLEVYPLTPHLHNPLPPPQQRLKEQTQTSPAAPLHSLSDLELTRIFGEWPEMLSRPHCISGAEG